ncbi:MAG: efflux RND transporter permease subunit [Bacteroidales bacterium]|nr:efflux RND transporter permease subunit [Bacteroidales bacterium]
MSTNSAGGVVRDFGNEYALCGMARTTDLDELSATLMKNSGDKPVTLADVAEVRIGILLVSRYQHLSPSGLSLRSAVVEESADRLNPILMTALTSALALIPLVLGGDKPGNEIQSPMAIVALTILRDLHLLLAELNAHRL